MAATVATYNPGAERQHVTLSAWAGNAGFAATPVAGDQIEAPDALTLNADGRVSGSEGTYVLRHIQADGTVEAVNHTVTGPVGTVVAYEVPADKTLVTLVDGAINTDPYLTGGFASPPEAGEQAITTTSEGAFTEDFYWVDEDGLDGVYTYWYVANDGVLYARTIDTAGLAEAMETLTFDVAESITADTVLTLVPANVFTLADAAESAISAELQKVAVLDASETSDSAFDAVAQKVGAVSLSESALTSETIDFAKVSLFAASESAFAGYEVTRSEVTTFTVSESAQTGLTVTLLPISFIEPVQRLPRSDLDSGGNYDQDSIKLYQGSWHKLIAPIGIGTEDVPGVLDARLQLFRGSDVALTLSLNNQIRFEDSELHIEFDASETVDLVRGYEYELWIVDLSSNPLFVRSGSLKFHPTLLRFTQWH